MLIATPPVMKGVTIVSLVMLIVILDVMKGAMIVRVVIQYAILPTVVVLVVKAVVRPAIAVIHLPAINVMQVVSQIIV